MKEGPVCFIIPPSVFLLDERVFMPLGILRVAAVLENNGIPVEMLDLSGIENYVDVIRAHLSLSRAAYFGITATTPQMPAAVKIAAAVRSLRADARLIIGGPHATLVNAAYKNEQKRSYYGRATKEMIALKGSFDVIVSGDGEKAIFVALAENPPKIVEADMPSSQLFLDNKGLDALPLPARHLVDMNSYRYFIDGKKATNIISQFGCPFGCRFCSGRNIAFFRRVRVRSVGSVALEMSSVYRQYGIEGFMFYDDELNIGSRTLALMSSLKVLQEELAVGFRLRGFVKSKLFSEEQAAAMYAAGFRWILVGFESGSLRILENINKRTSPEDNSRCVEIAHRHGLRVKALMCIGHPGESQETVMETHKWLLEAKPDDFDITIIVPYPGSPYYDDSKLLSAPHDNRPGIWIYTVPTGDRLYEIDVDFTQVAGYFKGVPGDYHSYVYTDYLSAEQLVALRDFIEQDVRQKLGIPFYAPGAVIRYRHSTEDGSALPSYILRKTQ